MEQPEPDEIPSVLTKLKKWADYDAFGDVVVPTRFIPCKTPLASQMILDWTLEEKPLHPLTVPTLLEANMANGRRIGMILDLSNHPTLYLEDLAAAGVEYQQVQLVAKVFPSQLAINRVREISSDFWQRRPEEYIAIHCAFGFNRTGFVLCAYLVQFCGLTVDAALASFKAARPPGVRHDDFVDELYERYGNSAPGLSATPSLTKRSTDSLASDFQGVERHLRGGKPPGGPTSPSSPDQPSLASENSEGTLLPEMAICTLVEEDEVSCTPKRIREGDGRRLRENESLNLDESRIYEEFAKQRKTDELAKVLETIQSGPLSTCPSLNSDEADLPSSFGSVGKSSRGETAAETPCAKSAAPHHDLTAATLLLGNFEKDVLLT